MSAPATATETKESEEVTCKDIASVCALNTVNESLFSFIARNIMYLGRYADAFYISTETRLSKKYRRSLLGFAWSLLNPLITMVTLTLVFSCLFQKAPGEYAAYLIAGLLPWTFFRDSIVNGSTSIIDAADFHRKINLPKLFFPLVTVLFEYTNFIFSIVAFCLLVPILGIKLHATMLLLPVILTLSMVFIASLVLIVSIATVYFRDLTHILTVLMNALFYFTPIFYSMDQVPEPYSKLIALNPLYHFVQLFQQVVFYGQMPTLANWGTCTILTAVAFLVSFSLLKRQESDIVFRI